MHRHLEEEAARSGSFGGIEMGNGAPAIHYYAYN